MYLEVWNISYLFPHFIVMFQLVIFQIVANTRESNSVQYWNEWTTDHFFLSYFGCCTVVKSEETHTVVTIVAYYNGMGGAYETHWSPRLTTSLQSGFVCSIYLNAYTISTDRFKGMQKMVIFPIYLASLKHTNCGYVWFWMVTLRRNWRLRICHLYLNY